MPGQIGTALQSISAPVTSAAGDVWNTLSSDASNLYKALPGVGSSPTSPLATPTPATSAVTSTPIPAGNATLPQDTSGLTATAPNPSGAAPAAAKPSGIGEAGNLLKTIASAVEMYQRYGLQQNLQNPKWVASQIGALQQPLSANLKNRVGTGVQAQMQEAGLGQAPGLFRQALAEALAPYQLSAQQAAEQEFNAATQASEGAYPVGGGLDDFGKILSDMYGGQQ
jgi:hypothetical protein